MRYKTTVRYTTGNPATCLTALPPLLINTSVFDSCHLLGMDIAVCGTRLHSTPQYHLYVMVQVTDGRKTGAEPDKRE